MKPTKVKCEQCKKIIGFDSSISLIEKCISCAKKETAKKFTTLTGNMARVKKGPALDLPKKYHNCSFRSRWEANFARILTKQKRDWEFESENCSFKFTGYKRKPWGYLCDFYLPEEDIYIEVKGYFMPRDKTKFKRLKAQYPPVANKLQLVLSKSNKKAIEFYTKNNVTIIYYEDLKEEWENKIKAWDK